MVLLIQHPLEVCYGEAVSTLKMILTYLLFVTDSSTFLLIKSSIIFFVAHTALSTATRTGLARFAQQMTTLAAFSAVMPDYWFRHLNGGVLEHSDAFRTGIRIRTGCLGATMRSIKMLHLGAHIVGAG
jgi:hypothetical protein